MANNISITQTINTLAMGSDLAPIIELCQIEDRVIQNILKQQYRVDGLYKNNSITVTPGLLKQLVHDIMLDEVVCLLDELDLRDCLTEEQLAKYLNQTLAQTKQSVYLVINEVTEEWYTTCPLLNQVIPRLVISSDFLGDGFIYLVTGKSIQYTKGSKVHIQVKDNQGSITVTQGIQIKEGLQQAYYIDS